MENAGAALIREVKPKLNGYFLSIILTGYLNVMLVIMYENLIEFGLPFC